MVKAFEEFSGFNVVLLNDITLDSTKELEDVAELKSYNGTVIYKYNSNEDDSFVYGSESFARVAKISDKDDISLNYNKQNVNKVFKLDKNLQGTIALCGVKNDDDSFLSQGYRYKQVKIEKVEA
jgi:NADH-quinone oxidoreductase subunit F